MDKAERPTITQADRDAAAEVERAQFALAPDIAEKVSALTIAGGRDNTITVQAFARHRTTSLAAQDGLVEALEWISKICDEEIPLEYNDAMRKAFQRNIRDAANKALSAIKEQRHD